VSHRRFSPKAHEFVYKVAYVWFDPDDPESLTEQHWAWSTGRFRPARIADADYGWPDDEPASRRIEQLLRDVESDISIGEVRFLTQPRRWGWLFNPISLYLAWPRSSEGRPIGAVLEVTNTPWKERHHYAVVFDSPRSEEAPQVTEMEATFAKDLHVSPFLPSDMTYHLRVSENRLSEGSGEWPTLSVMISVADRAGDTVLVTGMNLERRPATSRSLAETLRQDGLPTHRTSGGIHHQAARLLAKGVPFVPHPKRSTRHGST